MPTPRDYRKFMKGDLWLEMRDLPTDQQRRLPNPPLQEPYPADLRQIALVPPESLSVGGLSVREAIAGRRSHRAYTEASLSLEELSYLAWAAQGVHGVWRGGIALRRTVPSAGARHPFETYLVVQRVEGLEVGLYRYLSVEHKLVQLRVDPALPEQTALACSGQAFVAKSAVTFIWTALPYRTEWRYALMAPKLVNLDAGHVCENLYLAAESLGAGVCAIAAYDQQALDALIGVGGEDEFTIYVAPVGKV
ncbi:MAG: SagB/ThcOx family dehydrogenase [Anaerolineae bacterium]|nr:SagB/ThcOx family dehydrogenase [Anaerolineae bacterium]